MLEDVDDGIAISVVSGYSARQKGELTHAQRLCLNVASALMDDDIVGPVTDLIMELLTRKYGEGFDKLPTLH